MNDPGVSPKMLALLPRLVKATYALASAGLLGAVLAFLSSETGRGNLSSMVLYFPVAWILWISCALLVREQRFTHHLILTWIFIDLAALIFLLSLAVGVLDWSKSQGADLVALVAYFPVVIPTGLLIGVLPDGAQSVLLHALNGVGSLGGRSFGGVFVVWLNLSILGALQCSLIVIVSRYFRRARKSA